MDILTVTDTFRTEEAFVAYLSSRRWPTGPTCDKCGTVDDAAKLAHPREWRCRACGMNFSITAGTPMHRTHLPLPTWFAAIWLIGTSSKGVSAMVVSRQLDISYKSARFLCHRIRALLVEGDETLKGVVEVDERYLGGKRRRDAKSKRDSDDGQPKGRAGSRKMMAVVAVERDGKAKARKGKMHGGATIARAAFEWLAPNATLTTDELPAYRRIVRRLPAHLRVSHSAGQWSRRDPQSVVCAHTDTAESFNATIKRAIAGVRQWFSIKHTDRYLRELAVLWGMRRMPRMERFANILGRLSSATLNWKELTG